MLYSMYHLLARLEYYTGADVSIEKGEKTLVFRVQRRVGEKVLGMKHAVDVNQLVMLQEDGGEMLTDYIVKVWRNGLSRYENMDSDIGPDFSVAGL